MTGLSDALRGRDFLSLHDFTPAEVALLLDLAAQLKGDQGADCHPLRGKAVALVFQKPSTRTRISFEVAVGQLGGQPLYLNAADLQLGRGETVADTARVLSRYVAAVMIRTFAHAEAEELARHATVPVINGLTDRLHPCQALADLLTLRERKGELAGLRLSYVGDGNNVAHSLLFAGAKTGVDVRVAHPPGFAPDPEVLRAAREDARETGARLEVGTDPAAAVAGADAVYTDVWTSMGQESEREGRRAVFRPYQVDAALLSRAKPDAVFLHCLPAHRGEEVAAEVIDGPASAVFDQAENRLHAQKALLALLV